MQPFLGHSSTPKVIKWFIWITAACSLLFPLLTYFMLTAYKVHNFGLWLPLSLMGVKQGFVWQLLSYFFVHSVGTTFSLWFLIGLSFHLLLFWFAGSEVAKRYGPVKFTLFYLGGGIFAGLWTLLYFLIFNRFGLIVGSSPPVYALIMLWGMLYPHMNLHLFLVLRMSAKWMVLLLLGLSLLFNLFSGQFAYFIADFFGIVWGFCIGRFVWKLPNPYWGNRFN